MQAIQEVINFWELDSPLQNIHLIPTSGSIGLVSSGLPSVFPLLIEFPIYCAVLCDGTMYCLGGGTTSPTWDRCV